MWSQALWGVAGKSDEQRLETVKLSSAWQSDSDQPETDLDSSHLHLSDLQPIRSLNEGDFCSLGSVFKAAGESALSSVVNSGNKPGSLNNHQPATLKLNSSNKSGSMTTTHRDDWLLTSDQLLPQHKVSWPWRPVSILWSCSCMIWTPVWRWREKKFRPCLLSHLHTAVQSQTEVTVMLQCRTRSNKEAFR